MALLEKDITSLELSVETLYWISKALVVKKEDKEKIVS